VRGLRLTDVQQVFDQHAERGPPLTNMVLSNHGVSLPLQQSHRRVPDDGRP